MPKQNNHRVIDSERQCGLTISTVAFIAHEMGFAREVADRMLFFDHGQIIEQGPPEQIFTAPQQERTQQFLSQIL